MSKETPSQEQINEWHSNPSNWKLGIFYYNKEDKRIFPSKRIKQLGWTVNFANPRSIVSLIALIGFAYLLTKLIF